MDSSRAMKLVFLVAISHCLLSSNGFRFDVGGRDGWVLHPSEGYSNWAHRNRFVVNDTLYFKYKKGGDSVLEVTKDAYYNCNTSNPLLKMNNGSSEFNLTRSGPFFFISGFKDHCERGQKLLLIVISERRRHSVSPAVSPLAPSHAAATYSPAPTPAPLSSPPTVSPAPAEAPSSSPEQQSATAPGPSSSAPAPEIPAAEAPPATAPAAPHKAAASAMTSALTVSFGLIVGSSLFLGAL